MTKPKTKPEAYLIEQLQTSRWYAATLVEDKAGKTLPAKAAHQLIARIDGTIARINAAGIPGAVLWLKKQTDQQSADVLLLIEAHLAVDYGWLTDYRRTFPSEAIPTPPMEDQSKEQRSPDTDQPG